MSFWEFIIHNRLQILSLFVEHIQLTVISVGLAIAIGVPLGILITYYKRMDKPVLGIANLIQAVPSMALLGFAIPFLGIGPVPAVVVVILYSLLPIIKNTYTGIQNITPSMLEAARGIGLTQFQVLTKIKLPLALPIIMAGVRISAVTAVGLMTIAAFIGAGGLGFLVFSGIRTVNNSQILAGAIPACLLALFVDYLISQVEKAVTPKGIQSPEDQAKGGHAKWIVAITVVVICALFSYTFITKPAKYDRVITIAGKDYTEQQILVHLVADMIEDRTNIKVNRQPNLGGTQVCFAALKSGDIDLYIEYSGTAYGDTLGLPPISDVEEMYNVVKREFKTMYDIETLPQYNFNNTYTLTVKPETAARYNLKKISDLSRVASNLRMGATLEFLNREDGMPGLLRKYGFDFKQMIGIDGSQRYVAIMNNDVEIIDAFSTDGLLKKFGLVTLADDQQFFPPYYAMPIVRSEVLAEYPEIEPVLNELGSYLDEATMIELNYSVDELQLQPPEVAHQFLLEKGLIRP